MNNKAIETLSVNAVKDSIVMCDYLAPFISDNDKEPSWDGAVYIYKNRNHKKENLKGRLSVQVKGKECNDFSQDTISYPMDIVDLKNYLYDGGVILFVVFVYVVSDEVTQKIYYIELTPIKLRNTLEKAKESGTKTLKLKAFPTESDKKANIFYNCLQNCQKQASFVDAKLLSMDELKEMGVLESITVSVTAIGANDPQRALITNEVYFYANIKGSAIPQPLEFIPQHMTTNQEQNSIITVEDTIYYTKINIIKTAEITTYKFGESFTISFVDEAKPYKINYKDSTKVRILTRDLGFMLSCIEYGYFKFDGVKFPFDKAGANFSNFNIEQQKQRLEFAKRAVIALDMLNCKHDIDLRELGIEDMRNLEHLITAFVDKQSVANLKPDLLPIIKLNVGTLTFALCLQACEGIKGTYNIYDFFKTEMSMAYNGIDGEKLPISQYAILHADDFLTINNIRFEVLLPSFQSVQKHDDTFNQANCFLLHLLIAFDKSEGKRTEILKTAHEFANWLLNEASEDETQYHVNKINYLQVIKRERELNISELTELYSMAECSTTKKEILIGIYLLLGQQQAAEIHFKKLPPERQDSIKSYPIYHFWIKKKVNDNV